MSVITETDCLPSGGSGDADEGVVVSGKYPKGQEMSSCCSSALEQLLQKHRGRHQAGTPTGLCILLQHQCCAGSSAERRSLVGVKQHSVLSGDEALKQRDSEQQGCSEPQDAQQGH